MPLLQMIRRDVHLRIRVGGACATRVECPCRSWMIMLLVNIENRRSALPVERHALLAS